MTDMDMDAIAESYYAKHDPAFKGSPLLVGYQERLEMIESVYNEIDQAMHECLVLLDDIENRNIREAYAYLNLAFNRIYEEL